MACFLVVLATGCGGSYQAEEAIKDLNATNAQRLANMYTQHQRVNRGKGPADEKQFRKYVASLSSDTLSRYGVGEGEVESLFTSDRDEQPLDIRYGVKGHDRSDPEPVVFEVEGVNGKRMVGFTNYTSQEVESDSEYKELRGRGK